MGEQNAIKTEADNLSAPEVFVAIPNDNRIRQIYTKVIKTALNKNGFISRSSDEFQNAETIDPNIDQSQEYITKANLFVCDLTLNAVDREGSSPINGSNDVFYQLGIAHNLKKPTIIISQTSADLHFSIRHWCIIQYEDTNIGLVELQHRLTKWVTRLMSNTAPDDVSPDDNLEELALQRRNLYSSSSNTKRFALKYLGIYEDKESFPIVERMAAASIRYYSSYTDPGVDQETLRDAFTALFKIDPEKALYLLLDGLENGFWGDYFLVRERIVNLLGSDIYANPDSRLVNRMIDQINDTSWGVRQAVCQVLGKWGKGNALNRISERLNDPQLQVRMAAAEAFERLNLIKENDTEEPEVQEEIELTAQQKVTLFNKLSGNFNAEELKDLCFELDVSYDDLEATAHPGKCRELITYCERHGTIGDLITKIDILRPGKKTLLEKLNISNNNKIYGTAWK